MSVTPVTVPDEIVAAMGGAPPTDEQWAAISMPLQPYVLVAGAGSGKTSVMAARVVYLALAALDRIQPDDNPGVLPGNVLCLTFTVKATENLRNRVRRALSGIDLPEGEEPQIVNYHAMAAQVLDRYGILAGIEPGQRVLSQAQRVELAGRVLDEMTFDHVKTEWQPSVVDKILNLDAQAQNHLVEPDTIVEFCTSRLEALKGNRSDRAYYSALERIELARASAVFRRLKRDLGVIDFGDQIELAMRIATTHPEVGQDYRDRFGAVLLDEYQDTNVAQARLMEALFGGGHPVTAVGDPDQNIYAWRGAALSNLLDFPTVFSCSDGTPAPRLPLFTNFRSGARILGAADTVIGPLPANQRPDPEKRLVPFPPNGEGEVAVASHRDELTEAQWVADRIVTLHDDGARWSEVAVLCRTSRLFFLLQQAFAERDIPVEVVGLAGLLRLPEVVEVLAYARAANDAMASVALARILMGPRYRLGFKDLALVARWAKGKNYQWREEGGDDEDTPFLFAEALEHLDEVEGLSEDGVARLEEFRDELSDLRTQARRPVAEFLGEVIRRIGIVDELDADVDRVVAAQRGRNLAAFLEQVHGFEPVEGELTLRAFLDYVDAVEALDKEEWEPVQPTDEDAVKVMTIHQAKGLEFDHVFVPGVATGLLPSRRIQQNPAERGYSLDFELRGDASILPRFDGVLSHFKRDLQQQEIIEERRTMYVALTRARRSLWVSASTWYGENVNAKGPSEFFAELAAWGTDSGDATVTVAAGAPGDDEQNPMLGQRLNLVRDWPGPARPDDTDALFRSGWRAAAVEAVADGAVQATLVDSLEGEDRGTFERAAAERRQLASHLRDREAVEGGPGVERVPQTVGASAVITYAQCPKRFYWSSVRPLPRFSGPAARIGTEIHAWIERRARGQGQLLEMDDRPDLTDEELAGDPGRVERLRDAFMTSRFADASPLFAERAFLLRLGDSSVGGRIDAIFGTVDGPWEVVDWKTGRKPSSADPTAGLQLDIYGLAAVEIWGKASADVTLTYFYLASGEEVTRPMDDPDVVRQRVLASLDAIAAGEFDPTPGSWCRHCDFRSFCDAGKAWLAAQP
ncbi:MAG TPA: ATP-dependent DNA helicase [Actinomycetota bacterium]|jgi:ATP-dependent DNA helicase UvrD/PcrA|nr:ATP-dependent DNA helicase [Actinomycetota bacterium]